MGSAEGREIATVSWRSQTFQTVLVSTLVLPLGVPLLSPLLPLIRDTFALTDLQTSYLVSAYFLPSIVLSPLIGTVVDRVGRRPVLVSSLFLFGCVGIGIIVLREFTVIIVARLVQGLAAAGIFITTVTIIADSFRGVQRNVVFGMNVAVLSTGRALYPLFGGALARYGWRVPFVCYLAAILAGIFVLYRFRELERVRRSRTHVRIQGTIAGLPTVEALLLYGATITAETVAFGAILTALPFLLVADYGASPVTIGTTLMATTVAAAIIAAGSGRLARHFPNDQLIASGFVLSGGGLVGVGTAPSPTTITAGAILFGVGIGLILPAVDAAISDAVTEDFQASALSLRNSATGFGRAIGPLLFPALAPVTGYRILFFGAGIVTLTGGLGGMMTRR